MVEEFAEALKPGSEPSYAHDGIPDGTRSRIHYPFGLGMKKTLTFAGLVIDNKGVWIRDLFRRIIFDVDPSEISCEMCSIGKVGFFAEARQEAPTHQTHKE